MTSSSATTLSTDTNDNVEIMIIEKEEEEELGKNNPATTTTTTTTDESYDNDDEIAKEQEQQEEGNGFNSVSSSTNTTTMLATRTFAHGENGDTSTDTTDTSTIIMVNSKIRRFLIAFYGPLLVLCNITWAVDAISVIENWECLTCRADAEPTRVQYFLFYTIWNMWFTCITFALWVWYTRPPKNTQQQQTTTTTMTRIQTTTTTPTSSSTNNNNYHNGTESHGGEHTTTHFIVVDKLRQAKSVHRFFQVAAPLSTTVMISFILHTIMNDPKSYIDTEQCYLMIRSTWHKDIGNYNQADGGANNDDSTTTPPLVTAYLALNVITSTTMHYLLVPLMGYFYISGQLRYDSCLPWATFFIVILTVLISVVQALTGIQVYCGSSWAQLIAVVMATFAFDFIGIWLNRRHLGLMGAGLPGCCCLWNGEAAAAAAAETNRNANTTSTTSNHNLEASGEFIVGVRRELTKKIDEK